MVFSSRSPEGRDDKRSKALQRVVAGAGVAALAAGGIYMAHQWLQSQPSEVKALPHPEDIIVQSVTSVGPSNNPGVTDVTGSFVSKPVNIRDALNVIQLDIMYGHLRGYKPPTPVDSVRCTDDAARRYTAIVTAGSFACEVIFPSVSGPAAPHS